MSAGRNASGSMPAWLIRPTRRGEPEARTSLGRPTMRGSSVAPAAANGRTARAAAPSLPCHLQAGEGREGPGTAIAAHASRMDPHTQPRQSLIVPSPGRHLFIAQWRSGEAVPDAAQELVANGPIGIEPLLAVALLDGGIGGRPVFDFRGKPAGQFEGLMVGFRGQRYDEIEVEPLPVFEFLKSHGAMLGNIKAYLLH